MGNKPIRVLIVDDSSYMRFVLGKILGEDPDIEVAGAARDGLHALELLDEIKPDVVTLDLEMPRLDGFDALKRIMRDRPTPVVIVTSFTEQGRDPAIRALELGAVDFVRKPDKRESLTMSTIRDELVAKVKMAAAANPETAFQDRAATVNEAKIPALPAAPDIPMKRLVVIACSTGGPRALASLLPAIPADAPLGIIVVQHMPAGFTSSLAARLDMLSQVRVSEAADNDALRAGRAFVAPGGSHLRIRAGGRLYLSSDPPVNNVRPAADVTMKDAAVLYGSMAAGVVLTGMGADGAAGAAAIRAAGGAAIAQQRDDCVVDGMPAALIESGNADRVAPLARMAREILDLV